MWVGYVCSLVLIHYNDGDGLVVCVRLVTNRLQQLYHKQQRLIRKITLSKSDVISATSALVSIVININITYISMISLQSGPVLAIWHMGVLNTKQRLKLDIWYVYCSIAPHYLYFTWNCYGGLRRQYYHNLVALSHPYCNLMWYIHLWPSLVSQEWQIDIYARIGFKMADSKWNCRAKDRIMLFLLVETIISFISMQRLAYLYRNLLVDWNPVLVS